MRPVPYPNDDETGTQDDVLVADPLSASTMALWAEISRKNRTIFSEIFKTVPNDAVRNWDQYNVRITAGHDKIVFSKLTSIGICPEGPDWTCCTRRNT